MPNISVIVPVYNRPNEIDELLESISLQPLKPYEVIIVEDGSSDLCSTICNHFSSKLNLKYIFQENSGPALARNNGAKNAKGEWLLFLDSDTILPTNYFIDLDNYIDQNPDVDLWGGPDADRQDFSIIQKAINYAMTSPLTTGGIRGRKKSADVFYPRSFNMGIKKRLFEKAEGFENLRFGEDLDLSMRSLKLGAKSALFEDTFVYHKRRNNFKSFFKQVFNSGMARIYLNKRHPGTLKWIHFLPSAFTLYLVFLLFAGWTSELFWYPLLMISLIWFIHAISVTQSVVTASAAVLASIIQLAGYGMGFLKALIFSSNNEEFGFQENFYD